MGKRFRSVILLLLGLACLALGVRSALLPGAPIQGKDVLLLTPLFAIPFAAFALFVRATERNGLPRDGTPLSMRNRLGLAAKVLGLVSAGLFLLLLASWNSIAPHPWLGTAWMIAGTASSLLSIACAIVGVPRFRLHAIASAVLLPCWCVAAILLVKALID